MEDRETFWYFDYDLEYDAYCCRMDLDENEVYRIFSFERSHCAPINDYILTRRQ